MSRSSTTAPSILRFATPIGGSTTISRAESIASIVEQLWLMALRIEDGDLPEAERE